jgi:hypothetical protein
MRTILEILSLYGTIREILSLRNDTRDPEFMRKEPIYTDICAYTHMYTYTQIRTYT